MSEFTYKKIISDPKAKFIAAGGVGAATAPQIGQKVLVNMQAGAYPHWGLGDYTGVSYEVDNVAHGAFVLTSSLGE